MQLMRPTNPLKTLSKSRRGMTLVEIMVVIVVIGLIFPLFTLILNMYKETYYTDNRIKTEAQQKQALSYIDDNVRVANEFLAAVPSVYNDAYGATNAGSSGGLAWSYKGTSATTRVLMTKSYATTINSLNTARQPVFKYSVDFSCSTQMYYQPQLEFVSIYFLRESTLYRRVLTDTTSTLCPGNAQAQRQSCPPEITTGRHSSCQANDEVLATNINGLSVSYFQMSQANQAVEVDPAYTSTDPDILTEADYAIVTVTTTAGDGTVVSTLTQRMTKLN